MRIKKLIEIGISLVTIIAVFLFFNISLAVDVIDSYSETNDSGHVTQIYYGYREYGQSFTSSGTYTLTSAKFYLKRFGSPTDTLKVRIYAHSGTYGNSSIGTSSPLATSDGIDAATISTSYQLITFTFSGENQITLNPSTYYNTELFSSTEGSTGTDHTVQAFDCTSPIHSGNANYCNLNVTTCSTWASVNSCDVVFYIYGTTGGGGGEEVVISQPPPIIIFE